MKQNKEYLRNAMKRRLEQYPLALQARGNDAICRRLAALPDYQNASRLMAFLNMSHEVSLDSLLREALREGKEVYVPHCVARGHMEAVRLVSLDEVTQGAYGIREPLHRETYVSPTDMELIIVPGLAFDADGHRLGRGAGFYDRYLARTPAAAIAAVAWDIQIVSQVPTEGHDAIMPTIVTPTRCITNLYFDSVRGGNVVADS